MWRVGDGKSINIQGNKWIQKFFTFRIQTPRTVLVEDAKVVELIDIQSGTWNEELVKEILNVEEAEMVCSLPISLSGLPDKQIWAFSRNGQFDVKRAYYLEISRKRRDKGEMLKVLQIYGMCYGA